MAIFWRVLLSKTLATFWQLSFKKYWRYFGGFFKIFFWRFFSDFFFDFLVIFRRSFYDIFWQLYGDFFFYKIGDFWQLYQKKFMATLWRLFFHQKKFYLIIYYIFRSYVETDKAMPWTTKHKVCYGIIFAILGGFTEMIFLY